MPSGAREQPLPQRGPPAVLTKAASRRSPRGCLPPGGVQHVYPEDHVAFYNPHYKIFMRLNSLGEFDCSNFVNQTSDGSVRLPQGWVWERFAVRPLDVSPAA